MDVPAPSVASGTIPVDAQKGLGRQLRLKGSTISGLSGSTIVLKELTPGLEQAARMCSRDSVTSGRLVEGARLRTRAVFLADGSNQQIALLENRQVSPLVSECIMAFIARLTVDPRPGRVLVLVAEFEVP